MKRFLTAAALVAVLGFFAATVAMAFDFNKPPQVPKNSYTGGSIMMQQGQQNPQPPKPYVNNPPAQPKPATTWVNKVADSPERAACLNKCRENMEKSMESCKKSPDTPSELACRQAASRSYDACQKTCPAK